MLENVCAFVGALASLMLTIYVVRLRQGWLQSLGAVSFGLLALYEFRVGGSFSTALVGSLAIVLAGITLRRTWAIGLATFAVCVIIAPAVTEALHSGAATQATTQSSLQFSKVAFTCLLSLALLAVEARRHSVLTGAVRQERDLSRRLRDGSSNGILILDLQSRVIEWNPAMERMTGVARRNIVGKVFTGFPGFDGSFQHQESFRLAKQGIEIASTSITTGRDESDSPFRGYYSPVRNHNGEVSAVFAIITTIGAQTSADIFRDLVPIEAPAA
jgi:PAS domain S-box-containing protein